MIQTGYEHGPWCVKGQPDGSPFTHDGDCQKATTEPEDLTPLTPPAGMPYVVLLADVRGQETGPPERWPGVHLVIANTPVDAVRKVTADAPESEAWVMPALGVTHFKQEQLSATTGDGSYEHETVWAQVQRQVMDWPGMVLSVSAWLPCQQVGTAAQHCATCGHLAPEHLVVQEDGTEVLTGCHYEDPRQGCGCERWEDEQ